MSCTPLRSLRSTAILRVAILAIVLSPTVIAIQCYSCKATGSNEIEGNIHCLETANLEDCNDFYNYYSEVEDLSSSSAVDHVDPGDYNDAAYQHPGSNARADVKSQKHATGRRNKRVATTKIDKVKNEPSKNSKVKASELEYDYKAIEDYQYPTDRAKKGTTTRRPSSGDKTTVMISLGGDKSANSSSAASSDSTGQKFSLPTDREHYCYSMTRKNAWESYTIEKGCKKIDYCRTHEENLPEWSLPWNFCCDKSRCNAKLVKDKPQRIFAMGCRRTDDCIQGHNTRHVCPEMFQTCPKVSMNVVKMECRAKTRQAAGRHNLGGSLYSKEKKCFCAKGFYPKGPVCTSGATPSTLVSQICLDLTLKTFTLIYFLITSNTLTFY